MTRVQEGMERAAQVRAALSPEIIAKAEALVSSIPDLMNRMFVSPANEKGRQYMYIATWEEVLEWRKINTLNEMSNKEDTK